jgi:2,4-dienoyl-CoA reductase-like NADH-dependent reductase (Old Yellow Enzyme family)
MLNIFSEYEIKNLKLKNRIVMPPMCMYVAPETGMVTDWHVIHYATRAVGGTGLIIVEATAIAPEGRISAKDLGIWEDAHIPGLARIVNSVHENGAKIGIQLNHAGRKCTVKGMEIEAPSPIPYDEQSEIPKEMTKTDIDETVDEFRRAAIRANKAGFDLLQIHAAHGYLLSEFLSPLTKMIIEPLTTYSGQDPFKKFLLNIYRYILTHYLCLRNIYFSDTGCAILILTICCGWGADSIGLSSSSNSTSIFCVK